MAFLQNTMNDNISPRIGVVIPCYKVKEHILSVINGINNDISKIYIIDDKCPDNSGEYVKSHCSDQRITIIYHTKNKGVGGAVLSGYKAAIKDGIDVIVKIDGDNQMDPKLIPYFVNPILSGQADYTKGNRFYDLEKILTMPKLRLFGNAALSFMTKLSSGYYELFDPTNGYTAIHRDIAKSLPHHKISNRYFFESDMLFRLNISRAVVCDIPMDAKYDDEISNLKISIIIREFLFKNIRNFIKRIFYNYYLRDLSLASIELPIGLIMFTLGSIGGFNLWWSSTSNTVAAPAGTVTLYSLLILTGLQLILAFLGHDISSSPKRPQHRTKFITLLKLRENK